VFIVYKAVPGTSAKGSRYKPLLSDGFDYLCPDCGGYGTVPHKGKQVECPFCSGHCTISFEDPRVKNQGRKHSSTGQAKEE
jgi:DNA-directed RNA polymerase subunit RPC12/RpoP